MKCINLSRQPNVQIINESQSVPKHNMQTQQPLKKQKMKNKYSCRQNFSRIPETGHLNNNFIHDDHDCIELQKYDVRQFKHKILTELTYEDIE